MRRRKRWRKRLIAVLAVLLVLTAAFLIYFPGRQTPMAFTLGTGIGISGLQERVDDLQLKARDGAAFSETDQRFLRNLYTCFAKGGRLTIILRQSAAMMRRYLSCTGEPLSVSPRIFLDSRRVREEMDDLRRQATEDAQSSNGQQTEYRSSDFYMAGANSFDSMVGLYVGRIILWPAPNKHQLIWRAELPWEWPAYENNPAAQASFSIPNLRSLLFAEPEHALHIEDGLGEYLTRLGLAKPFLVYSEWTEKIPVD